MVSSSSASVCTIDVSLQVTCRKRHIKITVVVRSKVYIYCGCAHVSVQALRAVGTAGCLKGGPASDCFLCVTVRLQLLQTLSTSVNTHTLATASLKVCLLFQFNRANRSAYEYMRTQGNSCVHRAFSRHKGIHASRVHINNTDKCNLLH